MEHNTIFSTPAKVVTDRVSDKSKGFGFVTFASEDEAHTALTEMNGKVCTSLYHYFYILEIASYHAFLPRDKEKNGDLIDKQRLNLSLMVLFAVAFERKGYFCGLCKTNIQFSWRNSYSKRTSRGEN